LTWALIGILALWLLFTSMHRIAAEERGVVTPWPLQLHAVAGFGLALPSPIDRVQKVNVEKFGTKISGLRRKRR
jgi:membrane protease subunit HflK